MSATFEAGRNAVERRCSYPAWGECEDKRCGEWASEGTVEALSAPSHRLLFDDSANDGYATPQYHKHGWMPANRSRPDYEVLEALAATVDTRTPAEREYDEARRAWLYDDGVMAATFLRAADKLRAERRGT